MCVKIVRAKGEVEYDMSRPLEEQIRGSKHIVINYEPNDASVDKFLSEIDRFCQNGINANLNIKVIHNNHIAGAMVKKQVVGITKGLEFNALIKLMALAHAESDRKLEELAQYCMDGNCDVKQTT